MTSQTHLADNGMHTIFTPLTFAQTLPRMWRYITTGSLHTQQPRHPASSPPTLSAMDRAKAGTAARRPTSEAALLFKPESSEEESFQNRGSVA